MRPLWQDAVRPPPYALEIPVDHGVMVRRIRAAAGDNMSTDGRFGVAASLGLHVLDDLYRRELVPALRGRDRDGGSKHFFVAGCPVWLREYRRAKPG